MDVDECTAMAIQPCLSRQSGHVVRQSLRGHPRAGYQYRVAGGRFRYILSGCSPDVPGLRRTARLQSIRSGSSDRRCRNPPLLTAKQAHAISLSKVVWTCQVRC